jgi:peptidyl-tRNA hydrolase, PTH1 family
MEYTIVGLGNPGSEYEATRHNIGRMVVESLVTRWGTSDWRDDKKLRVKISQGALSKEVKVVLVLPDNYMNRSGGSVAPLITTKKQVERLVVVHDDIDIGLGTLRIVFNRGSGGHRGVESIERALKTRAYIRVRVGVVPTSPNGKLKKPKGEDTVYDFILKKLSKKEKEMIDEVVKRAVEAVETVVTKGRDEAMRAYNTTAVPTKVVIKTSAKK